MNNQQIEELVKELCNEKVSYKSYDGTMSTTNLVYRENEHNVRRIIKQYILDNRDEELATLKAKVFVYEEVISKSNFAPMFIKEEVKQEIEKL